jgi:hypothetical protein
LDPIFYRMLFYDFCPVISPSNGIIKVMFFFCYSSEVKK